MVVVSSMLSLGNNIIHKSQSIEAQCHIDLALIIKVPW